MQTVKWWRWVEVRDFWTTISTNKYPAGGIHPCTSHPCTSLLAGPAQASGLLASYCQSVLPGPLPAPVCSLWFYPGSSVFGLTLTSAGTMSSKVLPGPLPAPGCSLWFSHPPALFSSEPCWETGTLPTIQQFKSEDSYSMPAKDFVNFMLQFYQLKTNDFATCKIPSMYSITSAGCIWTLSSINLTSQACVIFPISNLSHPCLSPRVLPDVVGRGSQRP